MSAVLQEFITVLGPRVTGHLQGNAKLVITGIGAVFLDSEGARDAANTDGAADVTLSASESVFRAIMAGTQNPAAAYMTGKMKVDGSLPRALKIGTILTC